MVMHPSRSGGRAAVRHAAWIVITLFMPTWARAQSTPLACRTDSVAAALRAIPPTQTLANGALVVHNIYRDQVLQLLRADGQAPDVTVDSLVAVAFRPHRAFWMAYLGDEATFRRFSTQFLPFTSKVICELVPAVLVADIGGHFERAAGWLVQQTGVAPQGTWYFVYGHAATDMGGVGQRRMVADLSQLQPTPELLDNLAPHELAHLVYDRRPGAESQPLTVLARIVAEGIATYASFRAGNGSRTAAEAVGYTSVEWQWALAHEEELRTWVARRLCERSGATIDSIASRQTRIAPDAPTAIGYFLGFRMLERSAARRPQPGEWAQVFRQSPDAVSTSTRYFGRTACPPAGR